MLRLVLPMAYRGGFSDECGVFGVCDSEDAANLAYLGLYALQHRGQESAGIARSRTGRSTSSGRWATSRTCSARHAFRACRAARPSGTSGTRPRAPRCSPTPSRSSSPRARGPIGLAHNGNLVNAREIRALLEAKGALFTTTSDSEVIVHLIARSQAPTLADAIAEALLEVRGAYSLVILSREAIFAARDANGIRPLSLGIARLAGRRLRDLCVRPRRRPLRAGRPAR